MSTSLIELRLALLDSVRRGDAEAVERLLDAGADPDAADLVEGASALAHATRQGQERIAQLLVRYGARPAAPEAVPEPPARDPVPPTPAAPARQAAAPWQPALTRLYRAHGYVRRPIRGEEGIAKDESWQVRFLVSARREVAELRKVLAETGFACPAAVRIAGLVTQTLTGRAAVEHLRELVEAGDETRGGG